MAASSGRLDDFEAVADAGESAEVRETRWCSVRGPSAVSFLSTVHSVASRSLS